MSRDLPRFTQTELPACLLYRTFALEIPFGKVWAEQPSQPALSKGKKLKRRKERESRRRLTDIKTEAASVSGGREANHSRSASDPPRARTWGLRGLPVLSTADLPNEVFVIETIEGHRSIYESVKQHAQGPAVHLEQRDGTERSSEAVSGTSSNPSASQPVSSHPQRPQELNVAPGTQVPTPTAW